MIAAALAAAATLVVVTQDQTALRGAARESAPRQAVLWAGDALEVRGSIGDYLQVYDHRRERGGFVRAASTRPLPQQADDAPALRTLLGFLRDAPGSEALGIAYAAAYLRAAPAEAIDGNVFADLGVLAERLADRASALPPRGDNDLQPMAAQAHIDIASAYGITLVSVERDGGMRLCYDGEAYRRAMALPATAMARATAALGLTREDCIDRRMTAQARATHDTWRAEVLDRVDLNAVTPAERGRLHTRKAGVWASIAFTRSRQAEVMPDAVQAAGRRALDEFAAIDAGALMEADLPAYNDVAMRVGAVRWAVEAGTVARPSGPLSIDLRGGRPGETCIELRDRRRRDSSALVTRCTYGTVWSASATSETQGKALAVAVQPLDGWRELWVFREIDGGWIVHALPPADDGPARGYVEFAGWVPGGKQLLTASEARVAGRYRKRYAVVDLMTLATRRQADRPDSLSTFYRWQSPQWKARTLSLR